MTQKNLTEIVCIIDKSGSMDSIKNDAIGGFNAFLEGQKKVKGKANLTLVLFDTTYNMVYENVPVKKAKELTKDTYVPGGCTALLDAVGKTIDDVGERLNMTHEKDRPCKVIFCILTDGQENSSEKFTRKQIFDMISHQHGKYNWEFIYLGANQDSFAEAGSIGIAKGSTLNYNTKDIQHVFSGAMASCVTTYRTTGDVNLDPDSTDNS